MRKVHSKSGGNLNKERKGREGVEAGKAGCQRVARMSRYPVAVSMSLLIWHSEHARLSCQFHLAASFLLVPLSFFLKETEQKSAKEREGEQHRVMEKQDK